MHNYQYAVCQVTGNSQSYFDFPVTDDKTLYSSKRGQVSVI